MLSLLYYLFENYLAFGEQAPINENTIPQTDEEQPMLQTYYQPSRQSRTISNATLFKHVLKCFDQFLNPGSDNINYDSLRLLSRQEDTLLSHEAKRLLHVIVNTALLNSHHLGRTLALGTTLDLPTISSEQLNVLMSLSVMNPQLSVDELAQLCDATIINETPKEVVH